jgi:hypothetical protein
VPARARAWAALPQLACDQRAEFQHPAPHRFIGYRARARSAVPPHLGSSR